MPENLRDMHGTNNGFGTLETIQYIMKKIAN